MKSFFDIKSCNKACNILIKCREGVGEMNKITRKRIKLQRKENLNKKLALQVLFSIVLVSAVIFTKQLDTDLSKQFLNATNEIMTESIRPKEIGNDLKEFFSGVADKIPFMSNDKTEYVAPVSGKVYQNYGMVKGENSSFYNHGIDIVSNTQSIRSVSGGKVAQIGSNDKLSNYIVIEDGDRLIIYGQIHQSFVKEGDKVSKGDIIGALNEESMNLHIEVWEDGESVNPAKLFKIN